MFESARLRRPHDGAASDERPSPRGSARGFTLIEAVVTIALTGLVIAGLVASVRTLILSSSISYKAAEVETVVINAADRVGRAPQLCDYEAYVDAAALANGWDTATTSSTTERLIANTGNPATDWEPQPCPADVGPFEVQRITITVTTPDGSITRTAPVVKSEVG
jgi:type II secretory pathway pseudopilin PulG